MVSLYRAWAAWRGIGVPGVPGAHDALIQVGGVRFTAHARLLAAHSGYFKSILSRSWSDPPQFGIIEEPRTYEEAKDAERFETEYERERKELEARYQGTRNENNAQLTQEENVVYVPNVTPQQFWPLLAYMYTGYLELTPDNIYQVLLATHLLHMPRALELCRNYLSHSSANPTSHTTTVIKPIPSRKLPPFLSSPVPYRPIFGENSLPYLGTPYETPFKPVDSSTQPKRISVIESAGVVTVSSRDGDGNKNETPSANECINETNHKECPQGVEIPGNKTNNSRDRASAINLIKVKKTKLNQSRNEDLTETPESIVIIKGKSDLKMVTANDEKVIIDVACCDGPVRFHRVLNKAYKGTDKASSVNADDTSDTDDSYVEIEEDSRSCSGTPYDNCNAFSKSLQKQMNENIRNMASKHNENNPGYVSSDDTPGKADAFDDASNSLLSNKSQDTIFTCIYCNHTFKSQYCFQKHARRHINPVSIDAVNQGTVEFAPDECCKIKKMGIKVNAVSSGPRREVRLLDMNVQYYPCKTCGSKFPSYYFVHKHRKMCHADEIESVVEPSASDGNVETEPSPKKKMKLSVSSEDNQAADGGGAKETTSAR